MFHSLDKMPTVRFFRFSDTAVMPFRGTVGSAGMDLSCAEEATVPARGTFMVSTELGVEIPEGFYGWVTSRSGLARKGLVVEAGIIDSDYRGCIWIILYNHTDSDMEVRKGQRIAQMIVQPFCHPMTIEEKLLADVHETLRGTGGFGSTGSDLPIVETKAGKWVTWS
jgi:dUTP pyrophosphatase